MNAPGRNVLHDATREAHAASLRSLEAYVANRRKTFEAFSRLDPDSKLARDAKELLEKARRDYQDFAQSIGAAPTGDGENAG
jgi:hypothetical protein